MTSHDTIRTPPPVPTSPAAPTELPSAPSSHTPRTQERVSRAKALGEEVRRYYTALLALLGAAGLSLGSVLSGIGIKDWLERWGFWPTFALAVLGVLLAILTQARQAQREAIEAIERRADQQIHLQQEQGERQEERHQEMLELIMDGHARSIGDLRADITALRDDVAGLKEATGQPRRVSVPLTPPTGGGTMGGGRYG